MVTARVSFSGPVIEGSTVGLVCEATAGDLPISYSWTGLSGQDVSLADTDGTISVNISAGDYGHTHVQRRMNLEWEMTLWKLYKQVINALPWKHTPHF